uniref:Uncharacterized protein n=1 Tax=Trypanosoma congolense (strain IL3000) TaxID=1068625 RepID=G0UUH8_TRYCI|nr:conserved hypothetical protein [Trypanosoma congolense IL3000]
MNLLKKLRPHFSNEEDDFNACCGSSFEDEDTESSYVISSGRRKAHSTRTRRNEVLPEDQHWEELHKPSFRKRSSALEEVPTPRRPAKRSNPEAFSHLIISTAASRSRSQRKFVERMRDSKQSTPSPSRSVSPIATEAGLRLYTAAMGQLKRLAAMRTQKEEKIRSIEEKITFTPQITPLAKRMGDEAYKPPSETYRDIQNRTMEKRHLREREALEKFASVCTFKPTIAVNSAKLAKERQQKGPFKNVGERLCFEGGCHLIRRQLRKRIIEQREARKVISDFFISPRSASRVVQRLYDWEDKCRRKRAIAAEELVRDIGRMPTSARNSRRQRCPSREKQRRGRSASPPKRCHPRQTSVKRLRRIRDLYLKYLSHAKTERIRLRDIKRQVRMHHPGDKNVVTALSTSYSDADQINLQGFMECLCRYEEQHGTLTWGTPLRGRARTRSSLPPSRSRSRGASPIMNRKLRRELRGTRSKSCSQRREGQRSKGVTVPRPRSCSTSVRRDMALPIFHTNMEFLKGRGPHTSIEVDAKDSGRTKCLSDRPLRLKPGRGRRSNRANVVGDPACTLPN